MNTVPISQTREYRNAYARKWRLSEKAKAYRQEYKNRPEVIERKKSQRACDREVRHDRYMRYRDRINAKAKARYWADIVESRRRNREYGRRWRLRQPSFTQAKQRQLARIVAKIGRMKCEIRKVMSRYRFALKIRSALESGKSINSVANHFGISFELASRIRKDAGIEVLAGRGIDRAVICLKQVRSSQNRVIVYPVYFACMSKAARSIGLRSHHILNSIRRHGFAGGLRWVPAEDFSKWAASTDEIVSLKSKQEVLCLIKANRTLRSVHRMLAGSKNPGVSISPMAA